MTSTIYKIYCKDNKITDCYVGSTDNFKDRCKKHNTYCYNENSKDYNYKVYKFIRANGGMTNWIIEKIINCDEDNRYDAEVHYFKLLNSTLNSCFPRRTPKQYYLDNREEILEKKKKYQLDNKEKISEYNKQYHFDNKEQIKEQQKQYRINNKEHILEQQKKYRIDVQCECGSIVGGQYKLNRHYTSKKHKRYLETIE